MTGFCLFAILNFMKPIIRCDWVGDSPLMINYHDKEWGVPLHDDIKLFEFFILDAFQAGLSWHIVLKKRKGFKLAFNNFNPKLISKFKKRDVDRLLKDSSIIRNRMKIEATIVNANKFLEIEKEFKSFDKYIWQFVQYKTIKNSYKKISQLTSISKESIEMSKDLKSRGFKFVGPTICYAFMQAAGIVNDHTLNCFRREEV